MLFDISTLQTKKLNQMYSLFDVKLQLEFQITSLNNLIKSILKDFFNLLFKDLSKTSLRIELSSSILYNHFHYLNCIEGKLYYEIEYLIGEDINYKRYQLNCNKSFNQEEKKFIPLKNYIFKLVRKYKYVSYYIINTIIVNLFDTIASSVEIFNTDIEIKLGKIKINVNKENK
jgi:hypothetical protein